MSIFMYIDGINGESSDSGHKDWIDIRSISWGTGRKITSETSTRGDRESSNTKITDLTFKKFMDKATAKLFIEACCGVGKTIKIHLTKTGSGTGADVYMEYTLHNAIISDYKMAAWDDDIDRPIEKLKISFVKMETRYTPFDEDGIATAPIAVAFDTATNTTA